jgi:hypothetical protein
MHGTVLQLHIGEGVRDVPHTQGGRWPARELHCVVENFFWVLITRGQFVELLNKNQKIVKAQQLVSRRTRRKKKGIKHC